MNGSLAADSSRISAALLERRNPRPARRIPSSGTAPNPGPGYRLALLRRLHWPMLLIVPFNEPTKSIGSTCATLKTCLRWALISSWRRMVTPANSPRGCSESKPRTPARRFGIGRDWFARCARKGDAGTIRSGRSRRSRQPGRFSPRGPYRIQRTYRSFSSSVVNLSRMMAFPAFTASRAARASSSPGTS
jgi:hypothetical protein